MSWTFQVEFQPRDLWIGAYYEQRHNDHLAGTVLPDPTVIEWHLWVCLLPCVPIHMVRTTIVSSRSAGIGPA